MWEWDVRFSELLFVLACPAFKLRRRRVRHSVHVAYSDWRRRWWLSCLRRHICACVCFWRQVHVLRIPADVFRVYLPKLQAIMYEDNLKVEALKAAMKLDKLAPADIAEELKLFEKVTLNQGEMVRLPVLIWKLSSCARSLTIFFLKTRTRTLLASRPV